MYRKRTILYTNAKHGQKKYDTQTLNMDRKTAIHKHETCTEKVQTQTLNMGREVPCTNTKHGQKKYHTQAQTRAEKVP